MDRGDYATVSPDGVEWTDEEPGLRHAPLSRRLGCSDTTVDVYRTRVGAGVPLPASREQLCVPLEGGGTLTGDGTRRVRWHALVLVPAGTVAEARSTEAATWLVVGAPADPTPGAVLSVVDVEDLSYSLPATSAIATARLSERLGPAGMKVNVRRLDPGDAVPYHTEGTQEELFVPLDGDGTVRVDGETHPVGAGSVTRVAPVVPRSAVNPGESPVRWLMVGAPPTGGPDEWDPGAALHEWPGPD